MGGAPSTFATNAWLERVIIYGVHTEPKSITIESYANKQSAQLEFTFDPHGSTLLIRRPGVNINVDFTITLG